MRPGRKFGTQAPRTRTEAKVVSALVDADTHQKIAAYMQREDVGASDVVRRALYRFFLGEGM